MLAPHDTTRGRRATYTVADVLGQRDGALPGTPIDRSIRIDGVQHVCSAMIRASEWIDRAP